MRQAHRIIDGKKICGECGLNKSVDEFSKHGLTLAGNQRYAAICNDCRCPDRKHPFGFEPGTSTPVYHKNCKHCGLLFIATRRDRAYCDFCKSIASKTCSNYFPVYVPGDEIEFICECGNSIYWIATGKQGQPPSVCAICKRRKKRESKKCRQYAKRITVMNKDNWVCYLCNQDIPNLPVSEINNLLFGEIEHYIPLAKGGSKRLFNLRAAHRVCNQAKSDHIVNPGQFMLMNCPDCGYWVIDPTVMASGCKCGGQVVSGTPPTYYLDSEPIPQALINAMINAFAKKRKRYVSKFIVS